MGRNRLYRSLGILLLVAYAYVLWVLNQVYTHTEIVFCPFKNITGLACPSCGTTRSVMALLKGHFYEAGFINPLGFLAAAIMVILPFWLLYDLLLKKDTFYTCYHKTETSIKSKQTLLIVCTTCLMLTNWIWNIYKGL